MLVMANINEMAAAHSCIVSFGEDRHRSKYSGMAFKVYDRARLKRLSDWSYSDQPVLILAR